MVALQNFAKTIQTKYPHNESHDQWQYDLERKQV